MAHSIRIHVNDEPVALFQGMHVKHALIAYGHSSYEGVLAGELVVEDQRGFRVGLEGALSEGSRIYVRIPTQPRLDG